MKREDFEKLGDKHKAYEARTEYTLLPGIPTIVRLDGRAFHTFTKGLQRPYDIRMSMCMIQTAIDLVKATNANVAYVQSDEITLGFSGNQDLMFSGRIQKIVSLFASMASVYFNDHVRSNLPEKANLFPIFDARVFQYPTLDLAAETFLWRETDATRNSLTMAAHSVYTTTELHKAGFRKKHDMLMAKGINWNDYPAFFKRGTYVGTRIVRKKLSEEEMSYIPEKYRVPDKEYDRNVVMDLELPEFTKIINPVDVLFNGQGCLTL